MHAIYQVQSRHRDELCASIKSRNGALADGYEATFIANFETLDPAEKRLHSLIRGITIHSLTGSPFTRSSL